MPDGLLEIESLSPGPYQATRKIGWGLMEGPVSQACSLSPLWTLSPRRESKTLWLLATAVGLLFVLEQGSHSTFPLVPRGKRVGWFLPSLQNNGHSE